MDMKSIYCNNCGQRGHLFKECRRAVLSCGNLIFREDGIEPKVLMIQRKDSLCYIEFLRGKYDIFNITYIQILIDKCSVKEKCAILTEPFSSLWVALWLIPASDTNYMKSSDYKKGACKFQKLKDGFMYKKMDSEVDLSYFVRNSKFSYSGQEWEFPKGRRNNSESNFECAKREFNEETNYEDKDYTIIQNIRSFSEEFTGENKVRYKYIYYVGILTNLEKTVMVDKENKNQYNEIKDIRWFTKAESLAIIRDYHYTRKDVINKVFSLIDLLSEKCSLI